MTTDAHAAPLNVFNFHVSFADASLAGGEGGDIPLAEGAFAEISGLEATLEAKSIREGGLNGHAHQRPGPVSHATVILKRGITQAQQLARWFEVVGGGHYAGRLTVDIELRDGAQQPALRLRLLRALPVRFKTADLNARATEVGIEELHLVHEGLEVRT
jgi:phage tail-like protein